MPVHNVEYRIFPLLFIGMENYLNYRSHLAEMAVGHQVQEPDNAMGISAPTFLFLSRIPAGEAKCDHQLPVTEPRPRRN